MSSFPIMAPRIMLLEDWLQWTGRAPVVRAGGSVVCCLRSE